MQSWETGKKMPKHFKKLVWKCVLCGEGSPGHRIVLRK
jgi:hypothetical protein